jgi:hypothetical protein
VILDRVAKALLERESLDSDELALLVAGEPLPPEAPVPPAPVPAATQEVKSFPRPETAISQKPKLKPEATG